MKRKAKPVLLFALVLAMVLPLMSVFPVLGSNPLEFPRAETLESMSAADILRMFNDDSIASGENCTEAAVTRREYAPGGNTPGVSDSNLIMTKAFDSVTGEVVELSDNFFKDGFMFANTNKPEINIYVVAVDFPDAVGDLQIPYGRHVNAGRWGDMYIDYSRIETITSAVFGGSEGSAGGTFGPVKGLKELGNYTVNGNKKFDWNGTASMEYKGAAQRIEEMSMGRMDVNVINLNEEYAKLNGNADSEWWPWFRLPGSMISYAVQGPADCEDYNQFARLHGAALTKAREMIASVKAADESKTEDVDKVLKSMGSAGTSPIDLVFTIVPQNVFGHRAGLQGGGGLCTSFSFNETSLLAREGEYRHEAAINIEGRNIGSGVFGVKNIWSNGQTATFTLTSAPNIFLHEFYHGIGQFDDYNFGWMTGPNTGESATFTSSWTRDPGDRYAWRKFRNGWLKDEEVDIILPGTSKEVFIRALGSFDENGGPVNEDRLIVIPKEWRTRDTYGDPVGWRNDWNGYRDEYNWYDWFTNPWVGGATNSIKSFSTFYTLESRRSMGADNVIATNIEGVIVGYLANPTWETGHGAGGWKIVSGSAGLNASRSGATKSYSDPHIGLTITVLESTPEGDRVRIDYTGVPTNTAQHVYQAELTVSDSYAKAGDEFTVDFDILTLGTPAPNDAQDPAAGAVARVATPLGVPGGLSGFVMEVEYDAAKFAYVGANEGKFAYNVDAATAGKLIITATGNKMIDKDVILSLKFKALTLGAHQNAINATITDVTLINWQGKKLTKGNGFDGVGTFTGALPSFPTAAWTPGNLAVRGTLSNLYNTTAANTYTAGIKAWGRDALNVEYKSGTSATRLEIKGGNVTVTADSTYTVSGNVHSDTPGPEREGGTSVWNPVTRKNETGTWIGVESTVQLLQGAVVKYTAKSDWDGNYAINGVAPGNYTLKVTKPKYVAVEKSISVTAANMVQNVQLTRETFEVTGTIYVDTETSNGSQKVPAGAGVDVYVLSIGNAYRVLGKGVTDASGNYSVQSSSDNYGRPFCAVAVDVNTLPEEYKGEVKHQMKLTGTNTNGIKRGESLDLNLGRLFGMDPGDRVWPSNTETYGAGGSYNFQIDDSVNPTGVLNRRTGRDLVITSKQEVHIRTTTKSNQNKFQLRTYPEGEAVGGVVTSLGNANGDDIIFDVEPGMYFIEVMREGRIPVCTMPFAVDTTRVFLRDGATTNTLEIGPAIAAADTVSGHVIDAATGKPLSDVEIVFVGYGLTSSKGVPTKSNFDGTFNYQTVTGAKEIVFTKKGFEPVTVYLSSGGFSDFEVIMVPPNNAVRLNMTQWIVEKNKTFDVNPGFNGVIESNVAVLDFTFAKNLFDFKGFTPAAGVTQVSLEKTETGVRATVMVPDYNMKDFGKFEFMAREDVDLTTEKNKIVLTVNYVLREGDQKSTYMTKASTRFITSDGTDPTNPGGEFTLITLSNVIDYFGVKRGDADWSKAQYFDYERIGIINIANITHVASRIVL